jgi:hypothetical protein
MLASKVVALENQATNARTSEMDGAPGRNMTSASSNPALAQASIFCAIHLASITTNRRSGYATFIKLAG